MENFPNPFDEKFKARLAVYKPSTKPVERQKFAEAVAATVKRMKLQNELQKSKGDAPAEILDKMFATYCAMVEDPVIKAAVEVRIEICGSAPAATTEVFDETARPLDQAEEIYLRLKAQDIREIGKSIAKYILDVH